jgi:hypothetical protein
MINSQFASAGNSLQMLDNGTPEYPVKPMNIDEVLNCDYTGCHDEIPKPWIEVTLIEDEASYQKYTVIGDNDTWPGNAGWAVLDALFNNEANGLGPGEFTIDKGEVEVTYSVYWTDSNDSLFGRGGTNFTEITVPVSENTPPSAPVITGPIEGYKGTSYDYTFVSTDDDDHEIQYKVEWGDSNFEDWDISYPSGQGPTFSHTWADEGVYTITAQARDEKGELSELSTYEVNITNKTIEPKIKIRLKMIGIAKLRVTFENKGGEDLSDIQYNVTANGGLFRIFKRVHVHKGGIIENLAVGDKIEEKISDDSLKFRFCAAKVTVKAYVDGELVTTHSQYVVVIGRLVFARPILPLRP